MSFEPMSADDLSLKDGDRLFNVHGPWEFEMKDSDSLREYRYVGGFRRAAEVLGEHLLKQRHDVDVLAMPILFCYRQWAELCLKELWLLGVSVHDQSREPLGTHDLRVLWRHARPVLEDVWPDGDPAELDRVEAVLHELADVEGPRGEGFRYSVNKDGSISLPSGLAINLENVRRVMFKVGVMLDGAVDAIAMMRDSRAETEEEPYPY